MELLWRLGSSGFDGQDAQVATEERRIWIFHEAKGSTVLAIDRNAGTVGDN